METFIIPIISVVYPLQLKKEWDLEVERSSKGKNFSLNPTEYPAISSFGVNIVNSKMSIKLKLLLNSFLHYTFRKIFSI